MFKFLKISLDVKGDQFAQYMGWWSTDQDGAVPHAPHYSNWIVNKCIIKQPSKLLRGPGECIGASRALCIDKLGHVALISFCHSAVRLN